MIYNSKTIEKK